MGSTWRNACTSHVFTETPSLAAAASRRTLRLSGRRREICLVGRLEGRLRLVADEHELRVAACEPDLDPTFFELAGKLERGLAERLEEAPAEGGLEGAREELGGAGGRLVADRRYPGEVFTERLDIAVDLHDRSMTSQ
jgi:hypothetical protein